MSSIPDPTVVGVVDLELLTDRQLKHVSDLMKMNGKQLLSFNERIAEEEKRRYGLRPRPA